MIALIVLLASRRSGAARRRATVRIIPQARAGVVERLGRYHARSARACTGRAVRRPAPAADRPARAGRLLPAAAGHHRGQPRRRHRHRHLLPGHRRQGRDLRDRQLHPGDRAAHRHHAAQRRRRHGPRGDADQPRRDQRGSCAACSTRPPASGASASTASSSRRSTRRPRSRTRWRSRCAPSATSAPRSSPPRASSSRRSSRPRASKQAAILRAEGDEQAAHPARRGRGQGDRDRLRARSTPATPTRSCSPTSTCRCCPKSRRATRTSSGSSRASSHTPSSASKNDSRQTRTAKRRFRPSPSTSPASARHVQLERPAKAESPGEATGRGSQGLCTGSALGGRRRPSERRRRPRCRGGPRQTRCSRTQLV